MSGISETITNTKTSVFGFADDLSKSLDFGSSAPPNDPIKAQNPEMDISEIDRSNPTNLNSPAVFGMPLKYIAYGVGALAAIIVIKKIL